MAQGGVYAFTLNLQGGVFSLLPLRVKEGICKRVWVISRISPPSKFPGPPPTHTSPAMGRCLSMGLTAQRNGNPRRIPGEHDRQEGCGARMAGSSKRGRFRPNRPTISQHRAVFEPNSFYATVINRLEKPKEHSE